MDEIVQRYRQTVSWHHQTRERLLGLWKVWRTLRGRQVVARVGGARFEDDLADYQDEMTQLDERITDLRARYAVRFGAMESVVNSLKNTEQAIDSMMEAWRASLKN